MKKLMIVLAAVLISCSAYAQYAQFTFGPNVYSVDCYRNNLGDIVYVLPCMSPFKEHIQLLFTSEKVRAKFAKCLIWVKNKFAELNTTCYNDGITEIDKEMEYPNISKIKPIATFGDNITEARLDFYYVKKNNSTFVLLQVDKVESLSNSYSSFASSTCKF